MSRTVFASPKATADTQRFFGLRPKSASIRLVAVRGPALQYKIAVSYASASRHCGWVQHRSSRGLVPADGGGKTEASMGFNANRITMISASVDMRAGYEILSLSVANLLVLMSMSVKTLWFSFHALARSSRWSEPMPRSISAAQASERWYVRAFLRSRWLPTKRFTRLELLQFLDGYRLR